MNGLPRSLRPKHQVLVQKCYPAVRYNKSNVEVKPNSSELSYLLYYVSSRRSKLQKVGAYLDKQTAGDVRRGRIGNVQVTLHILSALVDKCHRDLPLFANSVLRVLLTVLLSNDLTLIEYSVPTFESFCAHQDTAGLAADQAYVALYTETLSRYADLASEPSLTLPIVMRYRSAGVQALKGAASSDSFEAESAVQLQIIVTAVLRILHLGHGAQYLNGLRQREAVRRPEPERDMSFKRRQSMSTVRTNDTMEADPLAASGTIEDADKLAEEAVGTLALQTLKLLCSTSNRGRFRSTIAAIFEYIMTSVKLEPSTTRSGLQTFSRENWSIVLLEMVCEWARVQDRFIIIVTAAEMLVSGSTAELDLNEQLAVASLIHWLLRSTVNFVGLSVIDVLIGFIDHIFRLLQASASQDENASLSSPPSTVAPESAVDGTISAVRLQLVEEIQHCIGNLGAHVYYADQITDMESTLIRRLHQPLTAAAPTASTANNTTANQPVSVIPQTLSFPDSLRVAALQAAQEILAVSNLPQFNEKTGVTRNKVGMAVWEGTEWLLRHSNWQVRTAYCKLLLTWLRNETSKDSQRFDEDDGGSLRGTKVEAPFKKNGSIRRPFPTPARDPSPRRRKSQFSRLLHLAIYDYALQHAHSQQDITLLYLLLAALSYRLGINSVRDGLPMILRLQEDIPRLATPLARVHIGSLVHGYLLVVSTTFDFAPSSTITASKITAEISRRKKDGIWLKSIRFPPPPYMDLVELCSPADQSKSDTLAANTIQTGILKPFDDKEEFVGRVLNGYRKVTTVGPSSPAPRSPGRSLSVSYVSGSNASPMSSSSAPVHRELPNFVREELLLDWTREQCLASVTKESSRSASLNGSRNGVVGGVGATAGPGSSGNRNNLLAVTIPRGSVGFHFDSPSMEYLNDPNFGRSAYSSVRQRPSRGYLRAAAAVAASVGAGAGAGAGSGALGGGHSPTSSHDPRGGGSGRDSPVPLSSSSVRSSVRVEELKRILASGGGPALAYTMKPNCLAMSDGGGGGDDTASESMISVGPSMSDISAFPSGRAQSRDGHEAGPAHTAIVRNVPAVPTMPSTSLTGHAGPTVPTINTNSAARSVPNYSTFARPITPAHQSPHHQHNHSTPIASVGTSTDITPAAGPGSGTSGFGFGFDFGTDPGPASIIRRVSSTSSSRRSDSRRYSPTNDTFQRAASPPAKAARELQSDFHMLADREGDSDVPPVPPVPASLQAHLARPSQFSASASGRASPPAGQRQNFTRSLHSRSHSRSQSLTSRADQRPYTADAGTSRTPHLTLSMATGDGAGAGDGADAGAGAGASTDLHGVSQAGLAAPPSPQRRRLSKRTRPRTRSNSTPDQSGRERDDDGGSSARKSVARMAKMPSISLKSLTSLTSLTGSTPALTSPGAGIPTTAATATIPTTNAGTAITTNTTPATATATATTPAPIGTALGGGPDASAGQHGSGARRGQTGDATVGPAALVTRLSLGPPFAFDPNMRRTPSPAPISTSPYVSPFSTYQ